MSKNSIFGPPLPKIKNPSILINSNIIFCNKYSYFREDWMLDVKVQSCSQCWGQQSMVHCTTGHRSLTLLRLTLVTTMLIISALRVLSSKSSSPSQVPRSHQSRCSQLPQLSSAMITGIRSQAAPLLSRSHQQYLSFLIIWPSFYIQLSNSHFVGDYYF